MSTGKTLRLNRLFRKDGKAVVVAADHGWMTDPTENVVQLKRIIEQVVAGGADGILVSFGIAANLADLLRGHDKPALILRADWMNMPRLGSGGVGESNVLPAQRFKRVEAARAEDALKMGACAITIYYFIGYSDEFEAENIRSCARYARECERIGLPVIIEPIATGGFVTGANITSLLIRSARIAAEIGADALKIPYTGDVRSFARLVKAAQVPVLMLGGAKSDNPRDALELVEEGQRAGAAGVVFGRNVTRAKDPQKMVQSICAIVHEGKTVDEVLRLPGRIRLKVHAAKCTGCLACILHCAASHNGKGLFGQLKTARLRVESYGFRSKVFFCTLCEKCIQACPKDALRLSPEVGFVELLREKCEHCGKCVEACPTKVIWLDEGGFPVICDLCDGTPQCAKWCFEEAIIIAKRS